MARISLFFSLFFRSLPSFLILWFTWVFEYSSSCHWNACEQKPTRALDPVLAPTGRAPGPYSVSLCLAGRGFGCRPATECCMVIFLSSSLRVVSAAAVLPFFSSVSLSEIYWGRGDAHVGDRRAARTVPGLSWRREKREQEGPKPTREERQESLRSCRCNSHCRFCAGSALFKLSILISNDGTSAAATAGEPATYDCLPLRSTWNATNRMDLQGESHHMRHESM